MRVSRVFIEQTLQTGKIIELDRDTGHYVANVLRLQADDPLLLFNGEDGEFTAIVASARKARVQIEVGTQKRTPDTPVLMINLALGLSRGDRMDLAIQKSTELGVTSLTPIYSEFGEVRFKQSSRLENKMRHWQRIAINACEQSGRVQIPTLHPPLSISDWIGQPKDGTNLILDPRGKSRIGQVCINDSVNLLIGPEGGFSDTELSMAADWGFTSIALGPRILRTETAPVAALAILQHRFGDMQ